MRHKEQGERQSGAECACVFTFIKGRVGRSVCVIKDRVRDRVGWSVCVIKDRVRDRVGWSVCAHIRKGQASEGQSGVECVCSYS